MRTDATRGDVAARALATRVLGELHAERGPTAVRPELLDRLTQALAEAHRRWPELALDQPTWCRYLAARLALLPDLEQAVQHARVTELLLCCACAAGEPLALAAFQALYLPVIQTELQRLRLGDGLREEVQQRLMMSLLVAGPNTPPMITRYGGTGQLSSWLRVVTARTARRALEQEKRTVLTDDERLADELVDGRPGAEALYNKSVYREAFRRAFAQAMGSLSARETNLLRQRFVDGLGLEQMAAIYRVHHTTIQRWVEKARLLVFQRTAAALAAHLRIAPAECSTIMRMIQSDIDLTLRSVLRSTAGTNNAAANGSGHR